MNPSPLWSFDRDTRLLKVSAINNVYLASREFIYVIVGQVQNPGQTEPTSSFSYKIFDPSGAEVETTSEGITFTAQAGGFALTSLEISETLINAQNVNYKFTMRP